MSLPQAVASHPSVFLAFRVVTITSMVFISGLSLCLSTWVIPNLFLAPAASKVKQFIATVTKGARYLMRASRMMMSALLLNTCLVAFHPDPDVSKKWTVWVAMSCTLITAAPYEIYFIFPINDRVAEMQKQIEKDRQPLTLGQENELEGLLNRWAFRNYGRVLLPLVAGMMGMFTL